MGKFARVNKRGSRTKRRMTRRSVIRKGEKLDWGGLVMNGGSEIVNKGRWTEERRLTKRRRVRGKGARLMGVVWGGRTRK